MSEVRVPVRVLPSGKVYRQMFDAEVQLVNSLRASKPGKLRLPPLQPSGDTPQETKSHGNILTERQKSWMLGMPNDYGIENPVKHRQTITEVAIKLLENMPETEVSKVRGLPNEVNKIKRESHVIDKITERRRERHEIAVEKMHDDLSTVSNRIEPRIVEIGQLLIDQLAEDDKKIEEIFSEIESDEELVSFSYEMLESVWKRVEDHAPTRRSWIEQADASYDQVENERLEAISGAFRKYSAVLEKIASLMPSDVQRFIEKESMMANQSILANRRAYAKLRINLLESDIQREMIQHLTWHERVQDWKKLNAEIAVKQFIEFMASESVCNPPEIGDVMKQYLEEQKCLEVKRKEILDQLLEFKPPSSTKISVYKWNSAIAKAQENVDKLHLKWIRSLNEIYEAICQRCLSEIDKYRKNLLLSEVCSDEDIQRIVNDHMLPLVGERQRQFEKILEQMDQVFESLAIRTEYQLKRLFKFIQQAAHLWDVHEIGLAKQERQFQSDLDESRQKHDIDNQERESKLDIVMDRLRQENTEDLLRTFFNKSLEMLEIIYAGYQDFYMQQLDIVEKYPKMVKFEINRYDEAVCLFFNIARSIPELPVTPQEIVSSIRSPTSSRSGSPNQVTLERRPVSTNRSQSSKSPASVPLKETPRVHRDTIIADKGTSFYVVTEADKKDFDEEVEEKQDETDERTSSALSGSAFLTEVSDDGAPEMPEYVISLFISTSEMINFKKTIRMQFLNHLEAWANQAFMKAENFTRDKREELASELDLRKHLHEPRARRIEVDVHNVRTAELVLHKERLSRHCKGITASLIGLKQDFDEMTKGHDSQATNFRADIEEMETVFISATKSAKLVDLTNSLHGNLHNYMQVIKASLRKFRQTLDNTLSRLRDSNAQCLKSFKLFSQGGNFSPDETVGLRKKLEKMSQRVDSAEGLIMHDLEGMESKRLDQATEVITKFEERFRHNMNDLTFVEKVQRWITNSQVRIKTEVQHCNGMGANVTRHVKLIKSRIDACKHPNPDKEDISPTFLCQYASEVMACLHGRADYLDCKVKFVQEPQPSSHEILERPVIDKPPSRQAGPTSATSPRRRSRQTSRGSQAGSHKPPQSGNVQSATDLLTGGGSKKVQHNEDSAIGMIKSILRLQKGFETEPEDIRSVLTGGTRQQPSTAASQIGTSRAQRGHRKQRTLSNVTGSTTDFEKGKKQDPESRVSSGSGYKRRETKFEGRHMVFGTKAPHGSHFEVKIQAILYETLDGLLSTGEIYYKQKGSRAVSRPQHMQDTFDQYSDVVTTKLLNYENQTKEFHNMALQEFRKQLQTLEEDLAEIPTLVMDEILKRSLDNLGREQLLVQAEFAVKEGKWDKIKEDHKTSLRPTLGHPDQKEVLQNLVKDEENRQAENIDGIHEHSKQLKKKAHDVAKGFLLNVTQSCLSLLQQFDFALIIDEVNSGQIEIKKEPTSILLRKKAAGIDLHDTSYKPSLPRGPRVWPGLDAGHLFQEDDDLSEVLEDIECTKTTLSHTSAVTKRDECLATFTEAYNSVMRDISRQEELSANSEQRWAENWTQSVKNVTELYT